MGKLLMAAIAATTSGAWVICPIALASLATTASGVPAGTNTPDQPSSAASG
ncbi:hypothetical protein D9M68_910840 [compost metagenome]